MTTLVTLLALFAYNERQHTNETSTKKQHV